MKTREKGNAAMMKWVNTGKFRHRVAMLLWHTLEPSPAAGFVLGGLFTAGMMWFAAPLLVDRPLLAAVLIATEIGGLAWIWQILYDRYWSAVV